MLSTGIPLLSCLEKLKQQPYTAYFKSILQVISEDVGGGMMLSDALDKHSKVFPDFFRSMLHVGEASGKLNSVFVSLADYYESDAAMKRKVKAALAYPMVLALMTVAVVILMLAFVVPTFRETLDEMDVAPMGITQVVYNISDFILGYWRIIVLLIFLFVGLFYLFSRTDVGKRTIDILKIKLPLIGKVQINVITARFSKALGLLLSSGMDLSSALDTISIILGNVYFEEKFNIAADEVRHGASLTASFKKQEIFPEMMIQMISVGEKTASLEEVLGRSSAFFDEQVEYSLTSMTSKIQPVMLTVMGLVIGTLFIAVYSPMLTIMEGLS
jgi:type IV pilus assembly protein PilC